MDLAEAHAALIEEIQYGITVLAGDAPVGAVGEVYEALSEQLQALGICYLLVDANVGMYRESLVRSAQARRSFLRRSLAEGNDRDHRLALGRTPALLSALVAGRLQIAREIAELSADRWNPDWEYEDDFCYYSFLHTLARRHDTFPTPDQHAILERFERALEGASSRRLDVCKAFVTRDAEAIAGALEGILEEEAAQIDEDRGAAHVLEGDVLFWPNSHVSVEALALLKVAELVGVPLTRPFPRCPSLGRLPWTHEASPDLFDEIDQLRAT